MKINKHTITELKQMQSLPLGLKIKMTQEEIKKRAEQEVELKQCHLMKLKG